MFMACGVQQFTSGQLVLSIPNAALASKLKQQLPKLQEGLLKRGWQVSAIRLKVQVGAGLEKSPPVKQLRLPDPAVAALNALHNSLVRAPHNAALLEALDRMVNRARR